MFFVLSGYLITRSLASEPVAEPLHRTLGRFYLNRCLRLFPAYYVTLAAVAGICAVAPAPFAESAAAAWPQLPWAATYTYNLCHAAPSCYEHSGFVSHFWSLAVEEQFYLLWPLFVLTTPVAARRQRFLALALAGPIVRGATGLAALGLGLTPVEASIAAYVLMPSHLDAFAAGAWALYARPRVTRQSLAGLSVGAAAIGVVWAAPWLPLGALLGNFGFPLFLTTGGFYVVGYSLLNAVSALLIASAAQGEPSLRFLDWGPLARLGKVSYAFYLVHLPVLDMLRLAWLGDRYRPIAAVLALVLSWGISELLQVGVERRFLALKRRAR